MTDISSFDGQSKDIICTTCEYAILHAVGTTDEMLDLICYCPMLQAEVFRAGDPKVLKTCDKYKPL